MVLVVSMLRLLEAFHTVMVPLLRPMVSAGDAGDADGDGAVVVVMRMIIH